MIWYKLFSKQKSFLLSILTLFLVSCNTSSYISGKLEGTTKEGVTIYLIKPNNLKEIAASYFGKVIDSALTDANGYFKFENTPKTTEPLLLELALKQSNKSPNYLNTYNPILSNYMPVLWQQGETIKVKTTTKNFQKNFIIENPSETNKALLKLRDINLKAYETYLYEKKWHLENGNQLLDKEHAVLQYQTALMNFANDTEHLMSALIALRWASPQNDYERIPEFLVSQCQKWNKIQPDHIWVKQLCEQSKPSKLPVLIGDEFPDVKLPTITKDTISLKNQLGKKITIVDLWASWCAPCRIENREILVPLWEAYHNQGLQIVAYALESSEKSWQAATDKDGAIRWLNVSELQGDNTSFLNKIRVQTIPANFILNDKGIVVAKNLHGEALKQWVKDYLEK
ncbi:TlpA family protein disulfide reductase [Winogradskyella endarachnes]|uniref:Redoxin domain-containing protein n=1 Tax=Winogradskyella endarachnes TaxID=2681965 RepID=A0A6L6U7Z3_9FLAO|nr:TlpA disulfide reductase family protein [Winogradskyella endarachnes]MUU78451.1 redoxin domain-containing protein [Winogradskyella endarachnes]